MLVTVKELVIQHELDGKLPICNKIEKEDISSGGGFLYPALFECGNIEVTAVPEGINACIPYEGPPADELLITYVDESQSECQIIPKVA